MPNWIRNRIEMPKVVWNEIKGKDENGNEVLDFNKVVPMPEELKDTESGTEEECAIICFISDKLKNNDAAELYGTHRILIDSFMLFGEASVNKAIERLREMPKEKLKELEEKGRKSVRLFEKYGACDWYAWRLINWGTKWNARGCHVMDNGGTVLILFSTPWTPPEAFYQALFKKYPNCEFRGTASESSPNFRNHKWRYSDENGYIEELIEDAERDAKELEDEMRDYLRQKEEGNA